MKKFKFLFALVALFACTNAFAQFTKSSSKKDIKKGWTTVYVQYSPLKMAAQSSSFNNSDGIFDYGGKKSVTLNGLSLGANHAFSLTTKAPLFLEVGGAIRYAFKTKMIREYDDYAEYKCKLNLLTLKVPVSVVYDIQATDNFEILPFAGLYLSYHFWLKSQNSA